MLHLLERENFCENIFGTFNRISLGVFHIEHYTELLHAVRKVLYIIIPLMKRYSFLRCRFSRKSIAFANYKTWYLYMVCGSSLMMVLLHKLFLDIHLFSRHTIAHFTWHECYFMDFPLSLSPFLHRHPPSCCLGKQVHLNNNYFHSLNMKTTVVVSLIYMLIKF